MKKNYKLLVLFVAIFGFVAINSCTKEDVTDTNSNSTKPANGNLVVWTNSSKDVGVLVVIKGPLISGGITDLQRIMKVKASQPNCGDIDCINYELPPGEYVMEDSRSTLNQTPVTIVSGGCTKINLSTVGQITGYGSIRFGTKNTTNGCYGQSIYITKNGVGIGQVNNTFICPNCSYSVGTTCNGSVGLDNLEADCGDGNSCGHNNYEATITSTSTLGPGITASYAFSITKGKCTYVDLSF